MSDRRLFALSDPHLSFASNKPMQVFGPAWERHPDILSEQWQDAVGPDDIVLVPGDISWALRLDAAKPDLLWLAELPGEKILLKGNHDYWWQSLGKLKALALPRMHFVQNNHVLVDGVAVGGARLWDFDFVRWPFEVGETVWGKAEADVPQKPEADPDKIRARELIRLENSLASLPKQAELRIAMTHFPPLGEDGEATPITDTIGKYDIDLCVFGHIHAVAARPRKGEDMVIGKTRYVLASTDVLGHRPKLLMKLPENRI